MSKKKLVIFSLVFALLTGCGASAPVDDGNTDSSAETVQGVSNDETPENAEVSDATEEKSSDDTSAADSVNPSEGKYDMRDITPKDLVAEMTTGWNLGNTFDSWGGSGLSDETYWGNPKTTKEMIDAVHDKGFNSIRIPVTWYDHMGAAPDYTVDEAWMDRVEEVVNYALDDGMYVIINSHHEEEWRIPDNAHIDAVDEQVKVLWVQIAERFEKYGDHLIFEGLNEPRVKGGQDEWNGGTQEVRECVNRLNQTFIDAVRSTGGNNEKRLVLITTVADSPVKPAINGLTIPDDEHMAVTIHAYTPYDFTFKSDNSYDTWDGSHKADIDYMFADLRNKFISKGIPVLLTEYGAVNKDGNEDEVCKWVTYYLGKAKELGIPCFWWDNGQFNAGNEFFGIFNRNTLSWEREKVADAIVEVYK